MYSIEFFIPFLISLRPLLIETRDTRVPVVEPIFSAETRRHSAMQCAETGSSDWQKSRDMTSWLSFCIPIPQAVPMACLLKVWSHLFLTAYKTYEHPKKDPNRVSCAQPGKHARATTWTALRLETNFQRQFTACNRGWETRIQSTERLE